MEKWDLYTKYREKTGREHIRGKEVPDGFYHLVVHVWIKNNKGQFLISKRAADRPSHPLMWESAGGSVIKGEDSLEGAIRETKEEVGIDLQKENGKLLFSKIRGKNHNDIMDVCFLNIMAGFPLKMQLLLKWQNVNAVSYTHLTLPTIYSV